MIQVVRTARAFLLRSDMPTTQQRFLHMASKFQGNLAQVKGPATCLSHCLRKLDWRIDGQGFVQVTAFLSFNLMQCSLKRFIRFMLQAWQEKFFMTFSHRTKW